jgi:UDP-N-acetyl-D-glucosamine dehydrogenase
LGSQGRQPDSEKSLNNKTATARWRDVASDQGEVEMKNNAQLRRSILSRRALVAVVGQGYVGLSTACAAADEGFSVTGIDRDVERIADLRQGLHSIPGVRSDLFEAGLHSGRLTFSTTPDAIATADIVLIAVPTPLRDHAPDLSFVESACQDVAKHMPSGAIIVLESTTYPGTTEDLVRPILESSGAREGRDFLLAYSPERIDPGNAEFELRNTPRVVGGLGSEATALAALFYEQLVDKVVVVSSCRSAELAKLLENTFRHVNIALVNEMAMLCNETGIDVWEVIGAAATKPFGFMVFHPGPGVGGHCIPLDPGYLAWQVRRDAGRQFRILEQAQDVNAQMPAYVASRIGDALNERGKAVKGADILVLGVAYKPDVGDTRESPAIQVLAHLRRRGAKVAFNDPYSESISFNGVHLLRTELSKRIVEAADCVAILTPHRLYDYEWIADHANLIFDATNAFGPSGINESVVRL